MSKHWISTDPALGEYIPQAPVRDEAKSTNGRNIFDDIGSAAKSAWEKTVDFANTTKDTVVNTVSAGWHAISYFHFEGRDEKNIITESYIVILHRSQIFRLE